jgi:hypothetical protein
MKKTFTHLLAFTLLTTPVLLFAQNAVGLENPIGVDSVAGLIRVVVKVIRYIAIPFVIIMIMWTGWEYILAAYGGGVTNKQHENLKWVLVGAFVILSAEMIAYVIENTLKQIP